MHYTYAADRWCQACGDAIRARLDAEGKTPSDPDDETTYDSGDYPKPVQDDVEFLTSSPEHCAARADCVDAIVLGEDFKIGAWLGNHLDELGARFVLERNLASPASLLARLWARLYEEELDTFIRDLGREAQHIEV